MPSRDLKSQLARYAQSLGFERFGVATAEPLKDQEQALNDWLAQGRAGEMSYLERDAERRSNPERLLAGARSVIALAMSYYVPSEPPENGEGRIARYARGRDYHGLIGKRLESFTRYLEALAPGTESRTFVDTGPLLERAFARKAGLGFIGKNTMLITRGLGSWVFLANVVTTLSLPADAPDERNCGDCRLCIDACPTQAITEPYELDPRRCLSYLTIELRGDVPETLRTLNAGWTFGCDVCQDVCPHNTRLPASREPAFQPDGASQVGLRAILEMADEDAFRQVFQGTPLTRAGLEGLQRNACLAATTLGRTDLIDLISHLEQASPSPMVRRHAAWASRQLSRRARI